VADLLLHTPQVPARPLPLPDDGLARLARLARLAVASRYAGVMVVGERGRTRVAGAGLPDGFPAEIALDSLTAGVLRSGEPVVLGDVSRGAPKHPNPAVRELRIASAAGVPILGPGGVVQGAVLVADVAPRRWTGAEVAALEDVAASALVELTLLPTLEQARQAERSAVHAEWRFRALVEHLPTVTYSCAWDEQGTIRSIGPQIEDLTGHPPQAFLDDPEFWHSVVHPDDRARVISEVADGVRTATPFESEYRLIGPDGEPRSVWDRETILRDEHGVPRESQGIMVDLTGMRDVEHELARTQQHLAGVIAGAPMILTAIDAQGVITLVQGAGLVRLGICPDSLVGRRAAETVPAGAARDAIARALCGETTSAIVGGELASFDVTWQPVIGPGGAVEGVIGVGIDVTAHHRDRQKLNHLARHDALTGLANREGLEEELQRRGRDREHPGLVVVDLDGFRTVNDSLGHAAGDEVLREAARRMTELAGREGALAARQGGDEFLLLLSAPTEAGLRVTAERVAFAALHAMEEPIQLGDSEFVMTATAGIASGDAESGAGELLRRADIALGQVGDAEVRIGWYAADQDEAHGRLTFTARVRRALARDEFALFWQPIVDPAGGNPVGMEALIRWDDPTVGLVPPSEFIPAAEACGLIDDIGRWVVDATCRQSRAWADEGLHPVASFNAAPRELLRHDFVDGLQAAIRRHGVTASQLVVEITESSAMRRPDRSNPVLGQIKDLGVRIAIDDFGAEHSSLARLSSLPVDMLKMDRGFLAGVPGEEHATSIVRAILGLTDALGMLAVAEGVETAEQLELLRDMGCTRVQGFHLARPMPAAEATAYLRAHGTSWARYDVAA
jgi:diguanylate cyclase (GGDEF)-like protein/PAS domain S-box-containing protein